MAAVTFDVTPATPVKRTHDDCIVVNPISAVNSDARSSSTELQSTSTRASPAPSSASSLTELTTTNDTPSSAVKSNPSTSAPPTKKRKLGFLEKEAEKAAKAREKDEKARAKAEEKAGREAEKQRKDEEKRRAAEEKENAKRAKELEKAEKQASLEAEKKEKEERKAAREAEKREKDAKKEAEKQAKEVEKLKKERSQMRLGAFFGKPRPESTPPIMPDDVSEGASSRRSSIASINMERPVFETKDTDGSVNPEYAKWILPFFVPEYTDVAPYNRFKLSRRAEFDVTSDSQSTACNLTKHFGRPRKRMKRIIPVKESISNIQASGLEGTELDSLTFGALGRISYKYLHFREDVRPPYYGTYTRLVSPTTCRKISRNPFTRGLPDKNYDYDSEAEWEPPGEDDEDLDEDDEVSVADDAEDEMADFLDDEDDTARRKGPLTDMEPVSSGLCWVGEQFDDRGTNLEQYRMDFLHDSTQFPIDPFSTKHWIDEFKPKTAVKAEPVMQPPRPPLASLSPNFVTSMKQGVGVDGKPVPPSVQKKLSNKPLKLIESEYMEDFKKAIDGSDLTKAGLIEILKKQFPKCSKDAIKDTLGAIAKRVGQKEADKKWQLVEP